MISRIDMLILEEKLKKYKVDTRSISDGFDRTRTILTSSKLSNSQREVCMRLIQAEAEILDMVQKIIAKTNPDTNIIIEKDDMKKERYRSLIQAILFIRTELSDIRTTTIEKILSYVSEKNSPTNEIKIGRYVSYVHGMLTNLVYLPLSEALAQYERTDEYIALTYEVDGKMKEEKIKRSSDLFWFYVYSYFLVSCQTLGTIAVQHKKELGVLSSPSLDVKGLGRAIGREFDRSLRLEKPNENDVDFPNNDESKDLFGEPEFGGEDEIPV